jgi:hypothetical protein
MRPDDVSSSSGPILRIARRRSSPLTHGTPVKLIRRRLLSKDETNEKKTPYPGPRQR